LQQPDGDYWHSFADGARNNEERIIFFPGEAAYGERSTHPGQFAHTCVQL
jgi:hypothetical protein